MGSPNPATITEINLERIIIWGELLPNKTEADYRLLAKLDVWRREFRRYQKEGVNQLDFTT